MAEALTLYQFTNLLTRHINAAPQLMGRWVVVEIARIGMSGPHCYCEFIEKDARGATIAKIKGTIWGNVWRRLSAKFYQATGRQIGAGMKVMFNMSASHSEAYGLSANVHDVDPAYTLGDAERRRREILEMLTREGLINSNRNLRLVYNPQKIAVISAAGAAGYGDFMHQIETSGFSFYPLLYPAAMQGVRTAESVIQALDRVEMAVDFWDCVIIIRGGGATDDLNSFDDPQLARRVAECPLPVIVGIGHERDRTVLDEIAHTRCKTPTAVAAFLIERLQACENHAVQLTQSVVDFTRNAIAGEERRLSHIGALLPLIAPRRLESEAHRLAELRSNI
ncbi:MAG: exodeoxyribonuclease VII large subunit, partial [Muribaculaceae bacterium]|nr:exodeoxyribonuclease VII large subunit [Muribaculaceae bacterium]